MLIVSEYNKGTSFCLFSLPIFQLPFPFQFQSTGLSWATAANNSMDKGGAQKSLAEIQAEEEGQERDRQERERKEKKARQKGTICFFFLKIQLTDRLGGKEARRLTNFS